VVFAPVDVRMASFAGAVDHVGRPELVEDLIHLGLVFHAVVGSMDNLTLGVEQVSEVATDPALAACEKKSGFGVHDWLLFASRVFVSELCRRIGGVRVC
jgi:hypothetical protein